MTWLLLLTTVCLDAAHAWYLTIGVYSLPWCSNRQCRSTMCNRLSKTLDLCRRYYESGNG